MSVAVAVIAAALVAVLQPSGSSSAAAAASAAAPAMGLPNCSTTCGDVEVPYPFGITPGCSYPAPGFNLTGDLTRHPPQLLLGDGTIRVIGVFLNNSTMLVHRTGAVNISGGSGSVIGYGMWPDGGFRDDAPFLLAGGSNELVVTGCNVLATLHDSNGIDLISGCSSFCSKAGDFFARYNTNGGKYCSGLGCCQAGIPVGGASFYVSSQWIDVRSQWIDVNNDTRGFMPASVFVAKVDWYDEEVNNARRMLWFRYYQ